jgi:tetratricopeptide (TPR) repeat protein
LSSGYAPAHFYYANFLVGRGRWEEALAEAREALKLDPVSIAAESNLSVLYYYAGRYDEALESCRKALVMEPALPRPHEDLGRILLEKGAFSEAVAALEKSVSLSGRELRFLASLGYTYGVIGKVDLARGILAELTEKAEHRYVAASDFAMVNAGLGDRDQAFYWLERAFKDRDSHLPYVQVDPRFASLRAESRFQELLERAGVRTAMNSGSGEECMFGEREKVRTSRRD